MTVGLTLLVPGVGLFLVGTAMTSGQDSIGGGLVKAAGLLFAGVSSFMIVSSIILWALSAILGKKI
jgi:hypothetical protein